MRNKLKLLFVTPIFLFSCGGSNCEELSKLYRDNECLIIVKNIPDSFSGAYFEIEGKSIKTGKDTVYKEENRWFCAYYDSISPRDTIIKRKGELMFNIHKKDTVLSFNYECDGKVYK